MYVNPAELLFHHAYQHQPCISLTLDCCFHSGYVKNFEMATKKHEKMTGPPPVELPPNFVSYDGTNDIKWNTRYAELMQYKGEHGDCKVGTPQQQITERNFPRAQHFINSPCSSHSPLFRRQVYTKTDLGRWVCSQRSARASMAKNLSSKRIELLDRQVQLSFEADIYPPKTQLSLSPIMMFYISLGFLWSGLPEGWARPIPGGDPRQNRAIAAKLVYPCLSLREVLRLGGFSEEELNAVKDPKHTWRTGG